MKPFAGFPRLTSYGSVVTASQTERDPERKQPQVQADH
jgi:hypothetical protein